MKVSKDASRTESKLDSIGSETNGLFEDFGIHILLEVTLVGFIDNTLNNTVLSMVIGICAVELCQYLWRKRRTDL